ncbi:MAG TPA: hypothetical protein VGN25_05225 [Solirubrobacteraceae bacterium]|jgi:hypothetical protein|nr:hypothetical protein [Solirubrobacteraceae bacterium]
MPRIIVTTDPSLPASSTTVLLDETVQSVHLSSEHAAAQLVQRLAWAVGDAESAEGTRPTRSAWPERAAPARRPRARSSARMAVSSGHLQVSSA